MAAASALSMAKEAGIDIAELDLAEIDERLAGLTEEALQRVAAGEVSDEIVPNDNTAYFDRAVEIAVRPRTMDGEALRTMGQHRAARPRRSPGNLHHHHPRFDGRLSRREFLRCTRLGA
jgi:hypothetical protein